MESSLIQIASFGNPVEAEQVRLVLENQGIAAFVDGANASNVLSHVGTALGGVRLLVAQHDVARATEIIRSSEGTTGSAEDAWFCGHCREEVDAGFDVCWSCGKDRDEVEQPFPHPSSESSSEATEQVDVDVDHVTENFAPERPAEDKLNPYASPLADSIPVPSEVKPSAETIVDPAVEAMLLRAWRASILGLVFFPILLHFYSMYLLIRASTLRTGFTPAGNRRFYQAFAVNLFVVSFLGLVFLAVFL